MGQRVFSMPELSVTEISPGQPQDGKIQYGWYESLFGSALLAVHNHQLCNLFFQEQAHQPFTPVLAEQLLSQYWHPAQLVYDPSATDASFSSIFGATHERQPLALMLRGTEFQRQVWQALLSIPPGTTTTYLAIAKAVGRPTATRAVGTAVGKNPIAFVVPCHRVIRQSGALGGYRWGLDCKQRILDWEAEFPRSA